MNSELDNIRKQKNKLYTQLLILIKEETIDNQNKNNNLVMNGGKKNITLKEAMENSLKLQLHK